MGLGACGGWWLILELGVMVVECVLGWMRMEWSAVLEL